MTPADKDFLDTVANARQAGYSVVAVQTDSPNLPWILFRKPSLQDVSLYTRESRENPLMGAIGLGRMVAIGLPAGIDLQALIEIKPFVLMRAVQVLLAELGLGVRAEKKSLN